MITANNRFMLCLDSDASHWPTLYYLEELSHRLKFSGMIGLYLFSVGHWDLPGRIQVVSIVYALIRRVGANHYELVKGKTLAKTCTREMEFAYGFHCCQGTQPSTGQWDWLSDWPLVRRPGPLFTSDARRVYNAITLPVCSLFRPYLEQSTMPSLTSVYFAAAVSGAAFFGKYSLSSCHSPSCSHPVCVLGVYAILTFTALYLL